MSEAEMIGMLVVAAGALIAVITPIIRLNGSIVQLTYTLKSIQKNDEVRDQRLNAHSEELDEHAKTLERHDVEIKHLQENKQN